MVSQRSWPPVNNFNPFKDETVFGNCLLQEQFVEYGLENRRFHNQSTDIIIISSSSSSSSSSSGSSSSPYFLLKVWTMRKHGSNPVQDNS